MTVEMYTHCKRELEDAIASGDGVRIKAAEGRILTGIMECQYKTSERVKTMVHDLGEIMKDHGAMLKSHKQYQADRAERRGAKKMLELLKYIIAIAGGSGGTAAVLKLAGSLN